MDKSKVFVSENNFRPEIREKYHIEIRPIMPPSEGMARDWWRDIIRAAGDWSMGESDPDELAPGLQGLAVREYVPWSKLHGHGAARVRDEHTER